MVKLPNCPLDSQMTGNTIVRFEDAPQKAISDVRASTSQVSSGSVLPQKKVKLAYKLLGVSSRMYRVLVFLDRVAYTDLLVCNFGKMY